MIQLIHILIFFIDIPCVRSCVLMVSLPKTLWLLWTFFTPFILIFSRIVWHQFRSITSNWMKYNKLLKRQGKIVGPSSLIVSSGPVSILGSFQLDHRPYWEFEVDKPSFLIVFNYSCGSTKWLLVYALSHLWVFQKRLN